ncbi:hypothetical protein ACWDTD_08030 [Gordonia sp. NPDC003425]
MSRRSTVCARARAVWCPTPPARPLVTHHRFTRADRRRIAALLTVIGVAALVAVGAWAGARAARPTPDDATRTAVLRAADAGIAALMTFGPADPVAHREAVSAHLTAPLSVRYAADGNDAVLPGSVGSQVSMSVRVLASGVERYSPDTARVLMFIDQRVSAPNGTPAPEPATRAGEPGGSEVVDRAPVARRVSMRNVDGTWLVADVTPVAPGR